MDEFISQTELGQIYGVSSHQIGKWLRGLGLRDDEGKPTKKAHDEGFVARRPSTQPGTYFYVWHKAKTTEQLDGMCYPRAK